MIRPVAEAKVDDSGFLQLAGLPAGTYSLEISHPDYVPVTKSPLEIWERKEMRLRNPVVLERPLTLEVVASPPLDWLDRPWHLELHRASRLTGTYDTAPVFEGTLDETGRALIPHQSPGSFTVQLIDSLGNPLFGALDHEVTGPADAQILIDLDLVVVRGTIRYQDEPITASLWFGLRHGAVHSEMAADLEGKFSGVLPEAGWWTVEIDAPSLGLARYQTRIEVDPNSGGEAEVEIELPETEVSGRVVDQEGRPVAGAEVVVATSQWGRRAESEDDGTFRFLVVEPGLAGIGATHQEAGIERTSDGHQIRVDEAQPTPPVELILRDLKAFQGRVLSERGPVPGAVVLIGTASPTSAAGQLETRTGIDGDFSVRLRAESRRLHGAVAPPGHALRAFELPASDTFELSVPVAGGTVALDLGPRPGQHDERQPELWGLYQDGLGLPFRVLYQWARGHNFAAMDEETGHWAVPRLAPGQYRLCRLAIAPVLGQEPTPVDCDEGFLSAGGHLELKLPRSRQTSR